MWQFISIHIIMHFYMFKKSISLCIELDIIENVWMLDSVKYLI